LINRLQNRHVSVCSGCGEEFPEHSPEYVNCHFENGVPVSAYCNRCWEELDDDYFLEKLDKIRENAHSNDEAVEEAIRTIKDIPISFD
jgi:hypothetical protein